jgi:hypothetical protein
MKYAKLDSKQLIFASNVIQDADRIIVNPRVEKLLELGYKEYITSPFPEQKKWYSPVVNYVETETQILEQYDYVKDSEPDRKELIINKIRERYDIDDELALTNKEKDDEDYIDYRNYVTECKILANKQIESYIES